MSHWERLEHLTRARALSAPTEGAAWRIISKQDRAVMRAYTTSFFIVSRFLPPVKRALVEAVYAAVRYPDEIVDTFQLGEGERMRMLEEWENFYDTALAHDSIRVSLRAGVPSFLAGFTKVVRERAIPAAHYRSFLDAMRRDVRPRAFETLDDLIENYIYGSAIVVGYFLAYVYGAKSAEDFGRALTSARDLGIALQLTNFLRDVGEDERRGRVYLPQEMLRAEGIASLETSDVRQHEALARVLRRVAAVAGKFYASSSANLDAFAPDCRLAIHACIKVYGRLNERIACSTRGIRHRESVPFKEKFRVLPQSKYWRIPLAYLFR